MCRLFGFRSNLSTPVHPGLLSEKNSLRNQSREHKDGWGIVAYAEQAAPQVAHGLTPAHQDPEFERVSGALQARAVLAHIRLASVGPICPANAHPFVHGRWAFAHNGTLTNFAAHRAALEAEIAPALLAKIQGDTDSERCFYLFLTRLGRRGPLDGAATDDVARALAETIATVSALTDAAGGTPSSMNFLVTDGEQMVATRRNRTLFFSPRPAAGEPVDGARVPELLIASEALSDDAPWHPVPEGGAVAVDRQLTLRLWSAGTLATHAEKSTA